MKTLINIATTISIIGSLTSGTVVAGNYQHNVLFNPSASQLNAEANGRIMIYDQLNNETVEQALNEQFDRIENMMFVRTRYAREDGSVDVDDDCD